MVNNALAPANTSIMEQVIIKGDLSQLKPDERARYYSEVCMSIGVNPLTKPFDYLSLSGKMVLYATKTATDQLRTVKGVSIFKVDAETVGDLRIVHAYARDSSGREDMDIGVVNIKGLGGEYLANAYMKALTKAKRRVTLSICGLGFLDESEVDSIPNARPINVNVQTGEIIDSPGDAAVAALPAGVTDSVTMITPNQIKHIHVLKDKKGLTDAGIKALHGKASAKQMTSSEASALIGKLGNMPDIVIDEPEDDDADQEPMFPGDPDRFLN